MRNLNGHTGAILSVCFSPDGYILASGSADLTIRLWDVKKGQSKNLLKGHTSNIFSVSFSPDGQTLASGSSDKTIRLWNVQKGQLMTKLVGHTNYVYSVCFSSNGTLASSSADNSILFWDFRIVNKNTKNNNRVEDTLATNITV